MVDKPTGLPDEGKIKDALGEDYDDFTKWRSSRDARKLQKDARDEAVAMISENGKYYDQYSKLDAQLNAIWNKALAEAKKARGIEDEEEGD